MTEHNWADNYSYRAARLHRPKTVEEIQEIVARADKVKALGTRHSFNDIADTAEDLVSTEHLDQVVGLDRETSSVTVQAGISYGRLSRYLDSEGFAVHNLASLPHISVAGACATGTHGSGEQNGNLSTAVRAMKIVTANGSIATFERDDPEFAGAVVHLGALGIVTQLTLDIQPAFTIRQAVHENLDLDQLLQHLDEVEASAYSVSLFTDWRAPRFNQVWLKRVAADGEFEPELFGAKLATHPLHPIPGVSAENCTEQMGVPGPSCERLPHFRLEFMPSAGEELQSEYLLPRDQAAPALQAIDRLRDQIAPLLQISEIRTVAPDNLWLSPSYQRPTLAIHFTWTKDWEGVRALLPRIEESLAPFQARPHWGKLFLMSPASLYERLPDFLDLIQGYDPEGKFRNGFLEKNVFLLKES